MRIINKKGFTLIELLVVIAIIGILSTIVIASLGDARAKGRDAKRIADLKNIELSLKLYFADNSARYPGTLDDLVTEGYLSVVPRDPSGDDYFYAALRIGASGSNCISFHLAAVLEANSTALADDVDAAPENTCTFSALTPDFHGYTADCNGASAEGTDQCYDIRP